jgi:hypothetical protein
MRLPDRMPTWSPVPARATRLRGLTDGCERQFVVGGVDDDEPEAVAVEPGVAELGVDVVDSWMTSNACCTSWRA